MESLVLAGHTDQVGVGRAELLGNDGEAGEWQRPAPGGKMAGLGGGRRGAPLSARLSEPLFPTSNMGDKENEHLSWARAVLDKTAWAQGHDKQSGMWLSFSWAVGAVKTWTLGAHSLRCRQGA